MFIEESIQTRHLSGHAALIRSVECDLLALQELTQASYDILAASGLFDWSAFSLTLRPPQPGEGRARSLGCAVFGRTPFTLSSFRLLESVRLPEWTLIATIETPPGPLTACGLGRMLHLFGSSSRGARGDSPRSARRAVGDFL